MSHNYAIESRRSRSIHHLLNVDFWLYAILTSNKKHTEGCRSPHPTTLFLFSVEHFVGFVNRFVDRSPWNPDRTGQHQIVRRAVLCYLPKGRVHLHEFYKRDMFLKQSFGRYSLTWDSFARVLPNSPVAFPSNSHPARLMRCQTKIKHFSLSTSGQK